MPEVRNTYGDRGLDRELDLMRAELRQLRAQLRAQAAAPAGQAAAVAGQAQTGPSSTFGRAAAAPTPTAPSRSPVVLPPGGVTSIFGRSGDVAAAAGDYLASQVTNALDESTGGTVLGPVTVSALLWALAGLGTKYAKVGGCLQSTDHFPDIGSSGTTETDLFSDSIVGATLGTDGDALGFEYHVELVNSASTKRFRVYFDGTSVFDTGALTISATSFLIVRGTIMRTGSSAVICGVTGIATGASTGSFANVTTLVGGNLATAKVLKCTGQAAGGAAANGDLVAKFGKLYWLPASG